MCTPYQTASQAGRATAGMVAIQTGRRRSAPRSISGVRPSTRSGGAQSASITFWSRWKLSIEVSARCSTGLKSAIEISARPDMKHAQRYQGTGSPRRRWARATTA